MLSGLYAKQQGGRGYTSQMANRYGEAALMAVRMELYGKALTPGERWQDAVQKLYPTPAGQKKNAPRAALSGSAKRDW